MSSPTTQMPWTAREVACNMLRAMDAYRDQVGHQLRQLRESRNMSQEDAAHLVGVAVKTWHNWETGKRSPYESSWQQISRAFKIDTRMLRGKAPELSEDASQLDRIEDKLDRVLSLLDQQPDVAQEIHQAIREYGAQLANGASERPPGSRRAKGRQPAARAAGSSGSR